MIFFFHFQVIKEWDPLEFQPNEVTYMHNLKKSLEDLGRCVDGIRFEGESVTHPGNFIHSILREANVSMYFVEIKDS